MGTAFIALGSNRRHPARQLSEAVRALDALPRSRVEAVSKVYRSAAVGPVTQPDYLNAVLRLRTPLRPLPLLDAMQAIERSQGRVRSIRWGPRTLDLDLILYDELQLRHPRLQLPHPRMAQRNFVLLPLADVADSKMLLPDGTELGTLVSRCRRDGLQPTLVRLEP